MKAGLDELNKTSSSSSSGGATATSGSHPTRWERSVMCAPGIIQSVLRFDKDGVDVLSFPGEHGGFNDVYRNIKNVNGFEERVNATAPHGDCMLGKAMEKMINEAFERGFDKRPTAILVLTAGRPNDYTELTKLLASTAKKVQNPNDLSITFVQIGNDIWAENYLKSLLTNQDINTNNAGESIDFIDVVLDDEIQKSLDQMKRESMNGVAGGLLGAVAGAGLGIGGAYLANKMNSKKRTKGWNGQWRFIVEGDELAVLEVKDDEEGNLIITGWPEGMDYSGTYATSEDGGMSLKLISATKMVSDEVIGVVEDEHTINCKCSMFTFTIYYMICTHTTLFVSFPCREQGMMGANGKRLTLRVLTGRPWPQPLQEVPPLAVPLELSWIRSSSIRRIVRSPQSMLLLWIAVPKCL
jgi:hypothetical protein